ncbi:MAG TPA: 4'-phosphopantetheinyl transferase superfamily protein [Solirubrobacteraceae bacterium]|jgi:holo-[acyl-carrier protein] synthase
MHGVGVDLVEIDEVRDSIQAFGERYLGRVFTPAERNECGASPARLAERFAAKEAILKALQVDGAVPLAAIHTHARGRGDLTVRLAGAAADLAVRRGVRRIGVSVSRGRGHATAVAITEPI